RVADGRDRAHAARGVDDGPPVGVVQVDAFGADDGRQVAVEGGEEGGGGRRHGGGGHGCASYPRRRLRPRTALMMARSAGAPTRLRTAGKAEVCGADPV